MDFLDVWRRSSTGQMVPILRPGDFLDIAGAQGHSLSDRLPWAWRCLTARWRALPDFLILGAMKAGTTSLFAALTRNPAVVPPAAKELHFFDGGLDVAADSYALGASWYRSHFPLAARLSVGRVTGEASPLYLFDERVPQRVHALVPNARLIVVIRNPTERALSHYDHSLRHGREWLPIDSALDAEDERLSADRPNPKGLRASHVWHSYKSRGRYVEQLLRFLQYFQPSQLFVLHSDVLWSDPDAALTAVCQFIGIRAHGGGMRMPREMSAPCRTAVQDATRHRLDRYFAPHNASLLALFQTTLAGRHLGTPESWPLV